LSLVVQSSGIFAALITRTALLAANAARLLFGNATERSLVRSFRYATLDTNGATTSSIQPSNRERGDDDSDQTSNSTQRILRAMTLPGSGFHVQERGERMGHRK
jgi:hypothetical protein